MHCWEVRVVHCSLNHWHSDEGATAFLPRRATSNVKAHSVCVGINLYMYFPTIILMVGNRLN